MSPAKGLYFAAELEIPADFLIVQYAEAINHRQRCTCPFNYFVGVKLQIWLVPDTSFQWRA
jgi:hypothetical protein